LHINSSISHMCNIDEFAKCSSFVWYPYLWYLFPLSKHHNYLISLVDICDVFDVFVFEVHQHTIRLNWAFGHALKQKILLVFCMTSFWYHVLLFNIYFMCTCFFVVKYLRDVVYLETYTHERWYLFIWYLIWTLCVGM
jgi:hypothetical protein